LRTQKKVARAQLCYFLDGKVALWSQRFGSTLQDNGHIHAQVRAQQMIFIAIKKRFKF
jgi:hypothetical protein